MKSILFHNACVITFVFFSLVLTFLLFKGISRVVTFSCIVWFSRCCFFQALLPPYSLYHSFFNLSSTFSSFFQIIFSLLAAALLSCNFYIISHCLPLVKYFFQKLFSKVLSLRPQALLNVFALRSDLPSRPHAYLPLSDSFFIISPFFYFVK